MGRQAGNERDDSLPPRQTGGKLDRYFRPPVAAVGYEHNSSPAAPQCAERSATSPQGPLAARNRALEPQQ